MSSIKTIGIDLGTTNSCVAAYMNGRPEVISNDSGTRTTPSMVAFSEGERIVGNIAKSQQKVNFQNTVYGAKRLIGRKFSEQDVQNDLQYFPFSVQRGESDIPMIHVTENDKDLALYPEQVSSMVLAKMLATANATTKHQIRSAVITVPAYFTDYQRTATKTAGELAGIDVLAIINEPTAAAIAYGFTDSSEQKVLVFDFGGGTLDVTILQITKDHKFLVLATLGDLHLGGDDIDNILTGYVIEKLKPQIDISSDKKAKIALKCLCEDAKAQLSSITTATIPFIYKGVSYPVDLNRATFEMVIDELLDRCEDTVESALDEAKLTTKQIDQILFVGGSSRIPAVRSRVEDYFDNRIAGHFVVNPDEAIAMGAAIYAEKIYMSLHPEEYDDEDGLIQLIQMTIQDIIPRSLGTTIEGGYFDAIIKKGSHIPITVKAKYPTQYDNQPYQINEIREGDDIISNNNILLDIFNVNGIPPGPAGTQVVEDTYSIDISGVLTVESVVVSNGKTYKLSIKPERFKFSPEIFAAIKEDNERYLSREMEIKAKSKVLEKMDNYVTRQLMNAKGKKYEKQLENYRIDIKNWMDANRSAPIKDIETKFANVQNEIKSITK